MDLNYFEVMAKLKEMFPDCWDEDSDGEIIIHTNYSRHTYEIDGQEYESDTLVSNLVDDAL
jgi:hypothetical protein